MDDIISEVAVLKDQMERLLGNGQPGIIDKHEERLNKHDRYLWMVIGIWVGVEFLTGTGTISLSKFLSLLAK